MRRYALLAALLVCGGCVQPNLVDCGDGTTCPRGAVCDVVHGTCVAQEQLDACADKTDFDPCETSVLIGRCFDNVCFSAGCGNGFVEPEETCDDGNTLDGDGCSDTCRSNESCGNGVVDAHDSEECDDGNIQSHDGCDSLCAVEVRDWRVTGISPNNPNRLNTAYHAVLGRAVTYERPLTWEWDGERWEIKSFTDGPGEEAFIALGYDPKQERVIALSDKAVWTWDGASWSTITTNPLDPLQTLLSMAYDESSGHFFVLSRSFEGQLLGYYVDPTTGQRRSANLPLINLEATSDALAMFDPVSRRLVFIVDGAARETYRQAQVGWDVSDGPPTEAVNRNTVIDPDTNQLVLFGGRRRSDSYANIANAYTFKFTDGVWIERADPPRVNSYAAAWTDPDGGIIVAGGELDGRIRTERIERIESGEVLSPPVPGTITAVAALPDEHALLAIASGETWRFTDRWEKVDVPQVSIYAAVWDPVRGGVIGVSAGKTWLFKNDTWTDLGFTAQPNCQVTSIAYDYARARVVGKSSNDTCALSSTADATIADQTWSSLGAGVGVGLGYMGYDSIARLPVLLNQSATAPGLYDLVQTSNPPGEMWINTLSPGTGYRPISIIDYGSILMVPVNNTQKPMWQRRAETWHNLGAPPAELDGFGVSLRGTAVVLAREGHMVLRYGFGQDAVEEVCTTEDDADGDGAAACADDDCWATCNATCPPVDTICN